MSPPEPEPDVPVERMATSDRDGKFAFADLTPGCYRLVAKVSGLARVQGLCTLREKRRVCEITLIAVPGVEFGGIVLDEDKRPVTGAEVEGHTDQGGYAKTTTDGSGRFHLVLGASYPERAVFSARADGYLPEHAAVRRRTPARLVLRRPHHISGVVLMKGRPVAGAEVEAVTDGSRAVADESGRFVLGNLPPAKVEIRARLDVRASPEEKIDLSRGSMEDVWLELREPGAVEIRVRDLDGRPVSGAQVHIEHMKHYDRWKKITGETGVARIDGVPEGSVHVRVHLPGSGEAEFILRVKPGVIHSRTVVVRPGHLVNVRVRLPEGLVPENTDVAVRLDPEELILLLGDLYYFDSDPADIPIAFSKVAEHGEAAFENVPPGRYLATLKSDDLVAEPVTVLVPGPEVKMVARGDVIEGRVVDQDGQSLAGVSVNISPMGKSLKRVSWIARTDALGRFRSSPREVGQRLVEVVDTDFISASKVRASAGDRDVVLTAKPAKMKTGEGSLRPRTPASPQVLVRGRVTDASGEPVNRFKVEDRYVFSRDGVFEVRVAADRYYSIDSPGCLSGSRRAKSKAAGDAVDVGTVRLRKWASFLVGEVVAPTGRPVPGATVRGWMESRTRMLIGGRDLSTRHFEVKTDSSGSFKLEMSLRSRVVLQAEMEGYGPSMSKEVGPVAGEDQHVRLELTGRPEEGSLQGTIKLRSVPAPKVRVSVVGWKVRSSMITGPDGRFYFDNVPPGRLFVSAVDCQGRRETTAVLLDPGDGHEFNLSLPHDQKTVPFDRDWCVRP